MSRVVGVDFGTTNSAIAVAGDGGAPRLAQFPGREGPTPIFRSILYFSPHPDDPDRPPVIHAGPHAIQAYLDSPGEGRLIQSTKSFLASRLFESTQVFNSTYALEDLISFILQALRSAAKEQFSSVGGAVVVGRPVRFVNAASEEDDDFARLRLRSALRLAGFDEVIFEHEPVAAALLYGSRLEREELVLIADFGGGTSDFSLLRLGPSRSGVARSEILGTGGVGLAGDAFDARIVRHLVAPRLGRGTQYRNVFGQVLPVPAWIYSHLERWHHLSFLKSRRTLQILYDLQREAVQRESIAALLHLVNQDRGYHLYRSVERSKCALSEQAQADFDFDDPPVEIEAELSREQFEGWIEGELGSIAGCVDALLAEAGVASEQVDRVFMTGGSSFVPAVRRIFERRFGPERMRRGGELTSVASGLALRALEWS